MRVVCNGGTFGSYFLLQLDMKSNRRCIWKAEATAFSVESTVRAKQIADSPSQNEMEKKRKEEGVSEGLFIQVVSRDLKKIIKR